jgi:adenosylhomocysteine nucleosidase
MSQSPLTLVCFAVKEEAKPFSQLAGPQPHLRTLITGMGWRHAEQAIRAALQKERPQRVLTCGFAGGLNPDLLTGTVVFSVDAATGLEPALRAAGAKAARFHCADRVAVTAQEKHVLRDRTGADAVEMESSIICKVCREQQISSGTVRVILDALDQDLPLDFNALMTPDQQMSYSKLARALLTSPSAIGRLMAFQKQCATAAQALGRVLTQAL